MLRSFCGNQPCRKSCGSKLHDLEKQLANFRVHTRDNPFARQYMWGAARNLDAPSVRNLATYFASLPLTSGQ